MPRGGLSLPAIETGKLQDDDGDITNNDDNSTNNMRSDRHFPVFGQGGSLRLWCICFCLRRKPGFQPAPLPWEEGWRRGGVCAARGSKSWALPPCCQTLPVISQLPPPGRGVCPESGQVKGWGGNQEVGSTHLPPPKRPSGGHSVCRQDASPGGQETARGRQAAGERLTLEKVRVPGRAGLHAS